MCGVRGDVPAHGQGRLMSLSTETSYSTDASYSTDVYFRTEASYGSDVYYSTAAVFTGYWVLTVYLAYKLNDIFRHYSMIQLGFEALAVLPEGLEA